MRRAGHHRPHAKPGGAAKGIPVRLSVAALLLVLFAVSFYLSLSSMTSGNAGSGRGSKINVEKLWETADSGSWRPSSAPRSNWPSPPIESNGYLRVHCNGGLNQQRSAICNAVLAARIMNATLVLPELDANSFWHDDSLHGKSHCFNDVVILKLNLSSLDAWRMLNQHPYCLAKPFPNILICCMSTDELQSIMSLFFSVVSKVGLILRAMGFDNSTKIYLAAGELFGGERFMNPFRAMFPRLENHSSVDPSEDLSQHTQGLIGSAVDYMVCLLSDIFMPTYDGPSNFASNLLGHRLYYSFRTTIRPDRKALSPIFIDREKGQKTGFEEAMRNAMLKTNFGSPHKRVSPESFYTNSWPECFWQLSPQNPADKCPDDNVIETLERRLRSEHKTGLESTNQSNLTMYATA